VGGSVLGFVRLLSAIHKKQRSDYSQFAGAIITKQVTNITVDLSPSTSQDQDRDGDRWDWGQGQLC